MKSKTQSPLRPIFKTKVESDCSEARVREIAREIGRALRPGDRVFFEGPMGAGKSTFIRHVLECLRITGQPQGSPTFSIAHEYLSAVGKIVHIDLFRLGSFAEVEMAGLLDYFQDDSEEGPIVLIEWGSRIPELLASDSSRSGVIQMDFGSDPLRQRNITLGG